MAPARDLLRWSLPLLLVAGSLPPLSFAQGTCDPDTPCSQGCCSTEGYCGFGPSFCGSGNCTSNCDAVAECGQYAPAGKSNCPLNVCCSQWGFCGTSEDFCDSKCQSGCDPVEAPSCAGSSSDQVTVGYYQSWTYGQNCDSWDPEDIDASLWTHINYAFALIGPDYRIAQMNKFDTELYARVTDLKTVNPGLKVSIAVGGWSAGGRVFSEMVASASSRSAFIESALSFMDTFGFDGIDIDWEYPAAADRGGAPEDTQNLVTFMRELKEACGTRYGVTATLPSSYWYLQGFDVTAMAEFVDWFNFMSYDIHGVWDGDSPYTRRVVQPHTNLTEIREGLDLLWRNNIDPGKVVLGLAFYGRSFTLKDPGCTKPGCAFSDGGKAGKCTKTSGILSNAEIQRIIKLNAISPELDEAAAVKYMTWDNDQWVSYDDDETIAMKKDFADNLCLRGTMVWALDLADPSNYVSVSNLFLQRMVDIDGEQARRNPRYAVAKYVATQQQNAVNLQTIWTKCGVLPRCPGGYKPLTMGHGKIFDMDQGHLSGDGCHGGWKGWNRVLCIEKDVVADQCAWYGTPGACSQGCPQGTVLVAKNTHRPDSPKGCKSGRYASFCCKDIRARVLHDCRGAVADDMFSGGLMPRLMQRNHDPRDSIPFQQAMGTIVECTKGDNPLRLINGGGQWRHYVPNNLAWEWTSDGRGRVIDPKQYPEESKPEPDIDYDGCYITVTETFEETTTGDIRIKTCDYKKYSQACQHYSSVIRNPDNKAETLVCPVTAPQMRSREIVTLYNDQHTSEWNSWVSKAPPKERKNIKKGLDVCERDEYPPHRFSDTPKSFTQWIRRVPLYQNKGAGQLWKDVCRIFERESSTQGGPVRKGTCTDLLYVTYTVSRFSMRFKNMPDDPEDGIVSNYCQLVESLTSDPGFALLTHDPWYHGAGRPTGAGWAARIYAYPIPEAMKAGIEAPRTRVPGKPLRHWIQEMYELDIEDLIIDEGNTTRLRSEDEIWQQYSRLLCGSDQCEDADWEAARLAALSMISNAALSTEHPTTVTVDSIVTTQDDTIAQPSGSFDSSHASNTAEGFVTVAFPGI